MNSISLIAIGLFRLFHLGWVNFGSLVYEELVYFIYVVKLMCRVVGSILIH